MFSYCICALYPECGVYGSSGVISACGGEFGCLCVLDSLFVDLLFRILIVVSGVPCSLNCRISGVWHNTGSVAFV